MEGVPVARNRLELALLRRPDGPSGRCAWRLRSRLLDDADHAVEALGRPALHRPLRCDVAGLGAGVDDDPVTVPFACLADEPRRQPRCDSSAPNVGMDT